MDVKTAQIQHGPEAQSINSQRHGGDTPSQLQAGDLNVHALVQPMLLVHPMSLLHPGRDLPLCRG